MADVVGPRNLRQGFASLAPRQGFSLLMLCEGHFQLTSSASNLRSLPAFGSSSPGSDAVQTRQGPQHSPV